MPATCSGVAISCPCPKLRLASWPLLCSVFCAGSTPALLCQPGAMRVLLPKPNASAMVKMLSPPSTRPSRMNRQLQLCASPFCRSTVPWAMLFAHRYTCPSISTAPTHSAEYQPSPCSSAAAASTGLNTEPTLNCAEARSIRLVSAAAMLAAMFCGSYCGTLTLASTCAVAHSSTRMHPRCIRLTAMPSHAR